MRDSRTYALQTVVRDDGRRGKAAEILKPF
jgi:hypothetical protein